MKITYDKTKDLGGNSDYRELLGALEDLYASSGAERYWKSKDAFGTKHKLQMPTDAVNGDQSNRNWPVIDDAYLLDKFDRDGNGTLERNELDGTAKDAGTAVRDRFIYDAKNATPLQVYTLAGLLQTRYDVLNVEEILNRLGGSLNDVVAKKDKIDFAALRMESTLDPDSVEVKNKSSGWACP